MTGMGKWLLPLAVIVPATGHPACFDLTKQSRITVSGRLVERVFPGSPKFESVAKGDAREPSYILDLSAPACADDGEMIAAKDRFRAVHLMPAADWFDLVLRAAVGKRITAYGEAFGAHTGHHHAPLVMLVERLRVTGGPTPAAVAPRLGGRPPRD